MYAGAISVAVKISDKNAPLTLTARDVNGTLLPSFVSLTVPEKA